MQVEIRITGTLAEAQYALAALELAPGQAEAGGR